MRVGKGADLIEPVQLADWIIQDRNDFRLIDLRQQKDYAAYHIPTARRIPSGFPDSGLRRAQRKAHSLLG